LAKFIAFMLSITLFINITVCNVKKNADEKVSYKMPGSLTTEKWIAPGNTVSNWYNEELGTGNIDFDIIQVSKLVNNEDIFAFLRFPLKSTWLADEIYSARLFLKMKEGIAPGLIRLGIANQTIWSSPFASLNEVKSSVSEQKLAIAEVKKEQNDWVSILVTDSVKSWLCGDSPNYGFALFGVAGEAHYIFNSGNNGEDLPYLEVSGATGKRLLTYGKFGFTDQPEEGNCMSYALRDKDMILSDDLGVDFDVMDCIYIKAGEDAVADYISKLVVNYVEKHKLKLQISQFRRIEKFDSNINAEKEYRIALRVGCKTYGDEVDLGTKGNYDYHYWAQINDGQWVQKFSLDIPEIIPCSSPGLSPGKYPWDSSPQWIEKSQNYYTSKVIYFAVTKDTDEFTMHKQ